MALFVWLSVAYAFSVDIRAARDASVTGDYRPANPQIYVHSLSILHPFYALLTDFAIVLAEEEARTASGAGGL